MQLPEFKLPQLDTSFVRTVPQLLWERARYPLGRNFKLPRIEANFNFRFPGSEKKPVFSMKGNLRIKHFDVDKSIKLTKEASYTR